MLRIFVRTIGWRCCIFTSWYSRISQSPFSYLMIMPVLKSEVVTILSVQTFREDVVSVAGYQKRVLDAHAELSRQVDARLHRDDHAGLQHRVAARGHAGRLVDLEPHAMSRAVPELLGIP